MKQADDNKALMQAMEESKERAMMTLFSCEETNVIIEKPYEGIRAGFCIVEKYDYVYSKELPRFNSIPGKKPYGLPYGSIPQKVYLGIGNLSQEKVPQKYPFYVEGCLKTESEVVEIRNTLFTKEHCDVVWFRVYGSDALPPDGYVSCGYDITFEPEFDGAFSIINDCMFICRYHGCDDEGTAFSSVFLLLNDNGLFDDVATAESYMRKYLSYDWSERGDYCICEIFRKTEQ